MIPTSEQIKWEVFNHHTIISQKSENDKVIVLGTFLYGSQNYGIDTPDSDIDTISLCVPSYEDFLMGEKVQNATFKMTDGSLATIKDFRTFITKILNGGDVSSLEILFTDYCVLSPHFSPYWEQLKANREAIAKINFSRILRSFKGQAVSYAKKFKEKPEPDLKYNRKALAHVYRITASISALLNGKLYMEALRNKDIVKHILRLRTEPLKVDAAQVVVDACMDHIDKIYREDIESSDNAKELKSYIKDIAMEAIEAIYDIH